MCGIVGIISFNGTKDYLKRKEWLTQALFANTLRGSDGTGVFAIPTDERKKTDASIEIYKKPYAGPDFIGLGPYQKIANNADWFKFIVGHNRAISKGKVCMAHTHPFQQDHITLVHNGHIPYMTDIHADWNKFDIDSELIAYAIAKEGYKEVLPKVAAYGAAALVWYDAKDDALFLYRNKDRPLYFAEMPDEKTTLFASEIGMLKWISSRNGFVLKDELIFDVGENQVCIFKDSHAPSEVVKIVPKPKTYGTWPTKGTTTSYTNSKKKNHKYLLADEIDSALRAKGLKRGDEVQFLVEDFEVNTNKSRHGKVTGCMDASPYADIVAYGVEEGKVPVGGISSGKISSAERITDGTIALVVTSVELVYAPAVDKTENLPVLADAVKQDAMIIGPQGLLIPMESFVRFTKHGCSRCQADIHATDASRLDWIGDNPICENCQDVQDRMLM